MNSPYGSPDDLSAWYDPGWVNTPSTDDDFAFDYDASPTVPGDFAQMPSSWTISNWSGPTPAAGPSAPQQQQYDFGQIWPLSPSYIDSQQQQRLPWTDQLNSSLFSMPQDGTTIATPPPPSSRPNTTTADVCTYPRNTTSGQLHSASDLLQSLFPIPTLPRAEPASLYDDDGYPLQKRDPRFEGDLYFPSYIQGQGTARQGWCGFCSRWYRLKDSAYW